MTEDERLALLARLFGPSPVRVGIGDDAAVIDPSGPVVLSVDAMVEDVHFRRAWLSFEDLGFKVVMAALSDLAAMGASPVAVLSALTLPADFEDASLEALARGQREACDQSGAAMVGGNLARGGELTLTITAVGTAERPLSRGGAQPGDRLVVTGEVGLARAGLFALERGLSTPALEPAVAAWRRPRAHVAEGRALLGRAHAAMDLSDGLAVDLGRMAEASGARFVLEASALRSERLERAAEALGEEVTQLALDGGEDYVLVAAVPTALEPWERTIGHVEAGRPEVVLVRDGSVERVTSGGFAHFR